MNSFNDICPNTLYRAASYIKMLFGHMRTMYIHMRLCIRPVVSASYNICLNMSMIPYLPKTDSVSHRPDCVDDQADLELHYPHMSCSLSHIVISPSVPVTMVTLQVHSS